MNNQAGSTAQNPAQILLVCHNRNGLAARRAVLEEAGYRVKTASAAEEAVACLAAEKFDLIITDHHVQKLDGVELIRKARSSGHQGPAILISGYVEALGLTEAGTGADAVLSKNSNEVTHLVRAVSRLLRQNIQKKPPARQRKITAARAQHA